jgi:hypothetical protein
LDDLANLHRARVGPREAGKIEDVAMGMHIASQLFPIALPLIKPRGKDFEPPQND